MLSLALYWFTISILVPVSIYIHTWFPTRTVSTDTSAKKYLIGTWCILNAILLTFIKVVRPSLPNLLIELSFILFLALFIGFVGSAAVLFKAYRAAKIIHIRRQIRLIGMSCFFVAAFWLLT